MRNLLAGSLLIVSGLTILSLAVANEQLAAQRDYYQDRAKRLNALHRYYVDLLNRNNVPAAEFDKIALDTIWGDPDTILVAED